MEPLNNNGPPMQLDRTFLHDRNNLLKILQIVFGVASLMVALHCFPDIDHLECISGVHNFPQVFIAMCINGFFIVVTSCLALCYLFSVPDAYYRYNFPLLEKLYTALAVTMYGIGVALVIIHIMAMFYTKWLIELGFISFTFLLYLFDFLPRWRNPLPQ